MTKILLRSQLASTMLKYTLGFVAASYIILLKGELTVSIISTFTLVGASVMQLMSLISNMLTFKMMYVLHYYLKGLITIIIAITFLTLDNKEFILTFMALGIITELSGNILGNKINAIINNRYGRFIDVVTNIDQIYRLIAYRGVLLAATLSALIDLIFVDNSKYLLMGLLVLSMIIETWYGLYVYYKYISNHNIKSDKENRENKEEVETPKEKKLDQVKIFLNKRIKIDWSRKYL